MANKKIFLLIVVVLFALFLFLRFYNLLIFPVFNDEAIYLNWAEAIHGNWTEFKFVSLLDGKPPLHYWILSIGYDWLSDPVYFGRLISILASIFGFLGIFLLTQSLFKSRVTTLIALIFYTLSPFILFYDRIILTDVFISVFGIYIFYFSWLLFKAGFSFIKNKRILWLRRVSLILVLGVIIGLARLTKPTILVLLLGIGLSLIWGVLKIKLKWKRAFVLILEFIIAYGLGEVIYQLVIPEEFFIYLQNKANTFIFSPQELLTLPIVQWSYNLRVVTEIFLNYLTWPLILIFAIGLFKKKKLSYPATPWLLICFVLPLIIIVTINKIPFFTRFFLMTIPFCIILIALTAKTILSDLSKFKYLKKASWLIWILFFLIILIPSFSQDWKYLKNPIKAEWTEVGRHDFINSWAAGYALTEVGNYLQAYTQDGQLLFLDLGSLGYPSAFFRLYKDRFPKLKMAQINFNLERNVAIAQSVESIKPILVLLNPDRRPEDERWEYGDICQTKKVFYQPNGVSHYTLCFID